MSYLNSLIAVLVVLSCSLPALGCAYGTTRHQDANDGIEQILQDSIQLESKNSVKSEMGYYLALRELARVKHAQGNNIEANKLFRRVSREVLLDERIPESTVSEIWLDAANFYERTGQYDLALKTIESTLRLNQRVLKFKANILPNDYSHSLSLVLCATKAKISLLKKLDRNSVAQWAWLKERQSLNIIGETECLRAKCLDFDPRFAGTILDHVNSKYFCYPPIPEDKQCYDLKSYRGRTIVSVGGKGHFQLHPKYMQMLVEKEQKMKERQSARTI
ncbi:MAG: hypothetical protein K2X81_09115 [Candidatus Obscuribacterales bacterium]|nr:hypothetical protein [Candidatus Obscuribacterales bacterium]